MKKLLLRVSRFPAKKDQKMAWSKRVRAILLKKGDGGQGIVYPRAIPYTLCRTHLCSWKQRFVVKLVFQLKESSPIGESFPMYWDQLLIGRGMACYSLFETRQEKLLKAGANIFLVEYLPKFYPQDQTDYPGLVNGEIARESWSLLPEIPLEQKLKELFKTLVITDTEGKVLLTLEDFSKARVEQKNRRYAIIIGEYLYQ